jgi:hypothetical protein
MTDRPAIEDLDDVPESDRWCCNGNAEDCALCTDPNPPYPFLCPGHPRTAANERVVGEATEATELDKSRRYLVPVARLELPGEPDLVHLSLYEWLPQFEAWATGLGLCGTSTRQGALPSGTKVTCPGCLRWQPVYEQILAQQALDAEASERKRRAEAAAGDTVENGAWFTVWLEGKWRWVTSRMTTPQREYAADCVAAYSRCLATVDGDLEREEPEGLRWWREAGR